MFTLSVLPKCQTLADVNQGPVVQNLMVVS